MAPSFGAARRALSGCRPTPASRSPTTPLLGRANFRHLRRVFEALVCRYRLRFRSAADVGTGTGLFACYLSRRWGIPVFAVDNAPAMLRVAARICAGLPVLPLCQDLRHLRLPYPVDLVTANSDVLNHLVSVADLRTALRRIRDGLRPDGHLVFDFVTPCEPLGGFRKFVRSVSREGRVAIQQIRWDPERRRLAGRVLVGGRDGRGWMVERHLERAYTPAEMFGALTDAGFRIRGVHDAATLDISEGCVPRNVVVATPTPGRSSVAAPLPATWQAPTPPAPPDGWSAGHCRSQRGRPGHPYRSRSGARIRPACPRCR